MKECCSTSSELNMLWCRQLRWRESDSE